MRIEAYAETDKGKIRESNEDRFLIDRGLGLYIVCDGMGGHAAGEVASENAARITAEILRTDRPDIETELAKPGGHFMVVQLVVDAVRNACQQVHAMANTIPECAGMGTTLTMLMIAGDKAVMAHVGDSRLYLLRQNELHLLTHDHTLSNEMIQNGQIERGSAAANRFANVLTRSIGAQEAVDVETLLFDIHPGDRLLLCSDGLSNYLFDKEETVQLLSTNDLETLPRELTELANRRGGQDNITCIVLGASEDGEVAAVDSLLQLDVLGRTPLFRGLKMSRLMRLANTCEITAFGADEWVIRRGDRRRGMYVVLEGSCTAAMPNGEKVTLTNGDSFGESALARAERSFLDVRASEPVRLVLLDRSKFRALVRRVPRFGRLLMEKLAAHLATQLDEFVGSGINLNESGVWTRVDSDEDQ